jgi:hypothetical protein
VYLAKFGNIQNMKNKKSLNTLSYCMQLQQNFFPKPRDFAIEYSFFKRPTKSLELGHNEKKTGKKNAHFRQNELFKIL